MLSSMAGSRYIVQEATLAPFLELSAQLRAKAQTTLKEPATEPECRARVQELLNRLLAAGVSLDSGWLAYAPEGYAVMYLRWAKWDVHKAMHRMVNMTRWHQAALPGEDPLQWKYEQFQEIFDARMFRRPGRVTKENHEIHVVRPLRAGHHLVDVLDVLRFNAWRLQDDAHDKAVLVEGSVLIYNFGDMTLGEAVAWFTRARNIMPHLSRFISECAPYRVQHLIVLHPPAFFRWVYGFFKPFLSKKIRSRLRLVGHDMKGLYELVDPAVLPKDCGGTNPDDGEEYWAALRHRVK